MFKASSAMTRNPVVVNRGTGVYEAISLMIDNEVAGLPVVNADGTVAGIITERDVLKLLYDAEDQQKTVEHFLTEDVVTFDEDDSLIDITECFLANPFRRVIITSGGRISGVVSRRDIIQYILNLRQKKLVDAG
ncbi:MAG: CBS domain-containing protein [Planctomycetes bacterium]|nr:CBS domain-containing protein [Planctomycetota bacterium]